MIRFLPWIATFAAPLVFASTPVLPTLGTGVGGETVRLTADELTIANFLRPYIRHLDHAVDTYHWEFANPERNERAQLASASDLRAARFVDTASKTYWQGWGKGGQGYVLGPGFYFASDPAITRDYGGNDSGTWILLRVILDERIAIFDLTGPDPNSYPAPVIAALSRSGCPELAKEGFLQSFARPYDQTHAKDCQPTIRKILDGYFGVDAIAYPYKASDYTGCDETAHAVAFVLTRSDHLPRTEISGMNSTTTGTEADRRRIQELLDASSETDSNELLWNDLGIKKRGGELPSKPRKALADWTATHLYGCGKRPVYRALDH